MAKIKSIGERGSLVSSHVYVGLVSLVSHSARYGRLCIPTGLIEYHAIAARTPILSSLLVGTVDAKCAPGAKHTASRTKLASHA
jgi:hypothetical protein